MLGHHTMTGKAGQLPCRSPLFRTKLSEVEKRDKKACSIIRHFPCQYDYFPKINQTKTVISRYSKDNFPLIMRVPEKVTPPGRFLVQFLLDSVQSPPSWKEYWA
jgi:hypothetical protein